MAFTTARDSVVHRCGTAGLRANSFKIELAKRTIVSALEQLLGSRA